MTASDKIPAPVALLSFPKCGRTWLKAMLKAYFERAFGIADLSFDGHENWHKQDARIPRFSVEHDDDPHFKKPDELHRSRQRFEKKRVVFLVRDPRDVMVSLFYEMTKRTKFYEDWGFDTERVKKDSDNVSQFIRGSVGRLATLLAYWSIWDDQQGVARAFTLSRYEDLHENAESEFARLLTFMEVGVEAQHVRDAVEDCRFESMRKSEARGGFDSKTLQPADPDDPDSFKVRKGVVGGFAEEMSAEDVLWMDQQIDTLPELFSCYRRQR